MYKTTVDCIGEQYTFKTKGIVHICFNGGFLCINEHTDKTVRTIFMVKADMVEVVRVNEKTEEEIIEVLKYIKPTKKEIVIKELEKLQMKRLEELKEE